MKYYYLQYNAHVCRDIHVDSHQRPIFQWLDSRPPWVHQIRRGEYYLFFPTNIQDQFSFCQPIHRFKTNYVLQVWQYHTRLTCSTLFAIRCLVVFVHCWAILPDGISRVSTDCHNYKNCMHAVVILMLVECVVLGMRLNYFVHTYNTKVCMQIVDIAWCRHWVDHTGMGSCYNVVTCTVYLCTDMKLTVTMNMPSFSIKKYAEWRHVHCTFIQQRYGYSRHE